MEAYKVLGIITIIAGVLSFTGVLWYVKLDALQGIILTFVGGVLALICGVIMLAKKTNMK
jgi:hypothetical protein